MISRRLLRIGMTAAAGFALFASSPAALAADKGPPSCARISFRALPSGQNDGEQEAGLYTSRFSHLELKATVKSGEPQDYYVTSHNKKLPAFSGAVPTAAATCAKSKNMPAPGKAADTCTGQRFSTVIVTTGKDKLVLLYGLHDRTWQFCNATTLAGG